MDEGISLAGKRALVTGGGRGIGRSIALALARYGADVALAARARDQLEAVAKEIQAMGRRSPVVVLDLENRGAIEPAVRQAADALEVSTSWSTTPVERSESGRI